MMRDCAKDEGVGNQTAEAEERCQLKEEETKILAKFRLVGKAFLFLTCTTLILGDQHGSYKAAQVGGIISVFWVGLLLFYFQKGLRELGVLQRRRFCLIHGRELFRDSLHGLRKARQLANMKDLSLPLTVLVTFSGIILGFWHFLGSQNTEVFLLAWPLLILVTLLPVFIIRWVLRSFEWKSSIRVLEGGIHTSEDFNEYLMISEDFIGFDELENITLVDEKSGYSTFRLGQMRTIHVEDVEGFLSAVKQTMGSSWEEIFVNDVDNH